MSSDYKVTSRSEDYIATVAAACRQARPQQRSYRFDPTDFIENVLMIDGVEAVWRNRWASPKGKLHFELFDRASKWDPPAEVSFRPKITLHFDRTFWTRAKAGQTHEAFIAAHEIGHILLHDVTAKEFSNESEARISFRKSDDESAEWQAHIFAGHLLLPTSVVQKIDDHDRLAFLCNAPDGLVAERLVTVRKIKKVLNPPRVFARPLLQDYCTGCGHFKDIAEGGVCCDCEEAKGRSNG
jgi:hypothetical protein